MHCATHLSSDIAKTQAKPTMTSLRVAKSEQGKSLMLMAQPMARPRGLQADLKSQVPSADAFS